ncbi:hypothetical protein HDU85_004209 [Gaertneriomyces sp. JEL0708]|nr:hypothetical protein HDU85_004209 [Gaertneriomyces sp. JEL0708]
MASFKRIGFAASVALAALANVNAREISFAGKAPVAQVAGANENLNGCVEAGKYDANYDYFPQKAVAPAGSAIEITYHNNYKIVKNKVANKSYLLHQCGTPAPTGIAGIDDTFAVPLQSVAVADTSAITYLELLGVREAIDVTMTADYITSACVQKMHEEKTVVAVNAANATATKALYESMGATLAFGDSGAEAAGNFVAFPATADPGELHRAQYLLYLAPFFNKEGAANQLFTSITDNYECVKSAASKADNKPSAAWFYQFNGTYYLSQAPYQVQYIDAANGKAITNPEKAFTDPVAFAAALKDADIGISVDLGFTTMEAFLKAYEKVPLGDAKFVKNQQVWSPNKRSNPFSGNDWFEGAVVNEHLVLADLVSILHPKILGSYETTFFVNVKDTNAINILDADKCASTASPLTLSTVQCQGGVAATTDNGASPAKAASWLSAGAVAAAAVAFL